jgi:hypothetical protein
MTAQFVIARSYLADRAKGDCYVLPGAALKRRIEHDALGNRRLRGAASTSPLHQAMQRAPLRGACKLPSGLIDRLLPSAMSRSEGVGTCARQ